MLIAKSLLSDINCLLKQYKFEMSINRWEKLDAVDKHQKIVSEN